MEAMAPYNSSNDPKVSKSIRLPQEIWDRIAWLADLDGVSDAEALRDCLNRGLHQREVESLDSQNKKLLNKKLKTRLADYEIAIEVLSNKNCSPQEHQHAINLLRRSLES